MGATKHKKYSGAPPSWRIRVDPVPQVNLGLNTLNNIL